jgi:hypothetical protein
MRTLSLAAGLSLLSVACAGERAADPAAPGLTVTSPERGTIRGGLGTIEVRGMAAISEESGAPIESVTVNGVPAMMSADGSFVAIIGARPGATLIHTIATDAEGGTATDTRTMLAGATTTADASIADAMTAAISREAFAKMGDAAATILGDTDLAAMVEPKNPVLKAGLDYEAYPDTGEDCLWIKGNVTGFEFNDPRIRLLPYDGGMRLEADFFDLYVPMNARYEFSCIDGNDTLDIRADRVSIAGDLNIWAENGGLHVDLQNADIDVDDLDFDGSGVPGAVLDLFNVDGLVEWALELGVESFMEPTINEMLAGIGGVSKELDLMGHTVQVDVVPEEFSFAQAGAKVRLASRLAVAGSEDGPGFIFTENVLPAMNTTEGFELALADDAANQLLAGMWQVGALTIDKPMAAGAFDSIRTNAMLPPMISADPTTGELRLIAGDLGVQFLNKGSLVGEVVLNLVMDLGVDASTGAVVLNIGEPVIYTDFKDDVENQTGFDKAALEAMIPMAVSFEMEHLLPLLGAIPLPSIGGVALTDVSVEGQSGYLTISGTME